jgi:SAM-dependent methyltransferase
MTHHPKQDASAASKNAEFFADNDKYIQLATRLATYRNIRGVIDQELSGTDRLIDIGNGGVFDYDTASVGAITAVDLFQESAAPLPPNVIFETGDALDLPFESESFDAVLMAMVFHHLTGARAYDLIENVERALAEAYRVLVPGGKFIVVESCIANWFFGVEKLMFPALARLTRTRMMEHPPALQLPPEVVAGLIAKKFGHLEQNERIPVGRLILQFGHRWPTALTPARPYLFTARRQTAADSTGGSV